jgi:AcrR family transcriptional regulator
MPRHVDHEDRRHQILMATREVLAQKGPGGLSIRNVAAAMGGSTTVVTHYYPSRQTLLDALVEGMVDWQEEIDAIEAGTTDQRERLRLFLQWLVPADEEGLLEETVRINLIGEHGSRLRTEHVFAAWDAKVRELLSRHLEGLVEPARMESTVDVLRSATNGITLSVVEHPTEWPAERQFAVIDEVLKAFGLSPALVAAAADHG